MSVKKIRIARAMNKYVILAFVAVFAVIGGIIFLFASRAATPITVNNSLANPTNLQAFGDDRVITVTWNAPSNASSQNIVGYYITWGEASTGRYTHAKQSTYTITQIQPIDNNKTYNIKVQSVQGNYQEVPTPGAHDDNSAPEARANGQVSPGVTTTATTSSARVDQLRQRMTGFFDDFNTPAGPFDELKWNQAGSACGAVDTAGAFINNQHHSHNQISTITPPGGEYCDRGQFATRARGVFDIAGRTDADPGEIVFDIDGAAEIEKRSIWYLDLIPTNARTSGAPVDVTAHASIFDDETSDPMGIRIAQDFSSVRVHYYDVNKQPHVITPTFNCTNSGFSGCNASSKVAGLSPLPEPSASLRPVPNVRRHWVVRMTTSKITIFIDSVRVFEGPIPADFRNITKYQVHSTVFGYNIGKDNPNNAKTFLFHWDNFGFNGPASPTVVHSYQEGGATGNIPYLGRGTIANAVPKGARTAVVKIPDQIGNPVKARLMFTLTAFGPGWYDYNSSHNIRVNGNTYAFAHPRNQVPAPVWSQWNGNQMGNGNSPMSLSIDINPAHLISGNNQIQLNIDGHHQALMNVHIELEYNRGSQPNYTQPKDIFGLTTFMTAVQPVLSSHDSYLFVEQNMGLQSGVIDSTPGASDTTAPTVSITSPANNTVYMRGSPVPLIISAADNVGVDKVDVYVDNATLPTHTITHSPYNYALDTTNLSIANHTIRVIAVDAANNSSQAATITINVANTRPPVPLPSLEAEDFLYISPVTNSADPNASKGYYIRF